MNVQHEDPNSSHSWTTIALPVVWVVNVIPSVHVSRATILIIILATWLGQWQGRCLCYDMIISCWSAMCSSFENGISCWKCMMKKRMDWHTNMRLGSSGYIMMVHVQSSGRKNGGPSSRLDAELSMQHVCACARPNMNVYMSVAFWLKGYDP